MKILFAVVVTTFFSSSIFCRVHNAWGDKFS